MIIISLSGCFNNNGNDDKDKNNDENNNKIDYPTENDLKLILDIDNRSIKNGINITIKLINIKNNPIKIDDYFGLCRGHLDLFLMGPNNISLDIEYLHLDYLTEYCILSPNEYLSINISLKNEIVTYQNENKEWVDWDWNTKGKYKIIAKYGITPLGIYSNGLEFEIT